MASFSEMPIKGVGSYVDLAIGKPADGSITHFTRLDLCKWSLPLKIGGYVRPEADGIFRAFFVRLVIGFEGIDLKGNMFCHREPKLIQLWCNDFPVLLVSQYKTNTMAYFWNPFCGAEIESGELILRLPDSGLFVRVEGPIVELLSQLPFEDIEASVRNWRERTVHSEATVQDASKVWHKLCDWGAIREEEVEVKSTSQMKQTWVTLAPNPKRSRVVRFVDAQEFFDGEEIFQVGA